MAMTGFIFQDDYLGKVAKLSDQELGRLVRALANYHVTGKEQELAGRESVAYDFIKDDIDKAEKAYAAKCEKNRQNRQGMLSSDNDRKRPSTAVNESVQNINIKEIKEKEINNNHSSARANPFIISEDEISEALERDRKIEDASRAWGLPCNEGNMIKARDMAREYSLDWLLRAIETAGNGKEQTWRYVAGILKSWKENGGPDAPKKQRASPGKTVSAQRYGQREYTEDELNSVGPDIIADAERERAYQASVVLETTDETMNRLLDEAKEQRSTA